MKLEARVQGFLGSLPLCTSVFHRLHEGGTREKRKGETIKKLLLGYRSFLIIPIGMEDVYSELGTLLLDVAIGASYKF